MRDRVAAYMVRAAATGAFNYANSDPYDNKWRLRHRLILHEVARQADAQLLQEIHGHWLAYVSRSHLEPDSWDFVKKKADETLTAISSNVYPWTAGKEKAETAQSEDTIYAKYGDLIDSYRAMVAEKTAGNKKAEQ